MLISIHQPYYIPWMGFFHKILISDKMVLLDHVQYADKDMQNRNYIKTSQGKLLLTVPVLLPRYDISALEVKIDNSQKWAKKHWFSLEQNYSRARYFKKYRDFFFDVYQRSWEGLIDLNIHIIKFVAGEFGLTTGFVRSSELGLETLKNQLLVDICHKVGAESFLSGSFAAKAYLDHDIFGKNNIQLFVHEFKHPEYPQLHGAFVPQLSAIDLLLNCGPQGRSYLEQGGGRPDA